MIAQKPSPRVVVGVCAVFVAGLLLLSRGSPSYSGWKYAKVDEPFHVSNPNHLSRTGTRIPADTTSELGRASNATLGFERVFALGLRERTDKRDALTVASSLTGFQVEFIDAVKGESVPDKAKPPNVILGGSQLGSWRSHLNAINRIVEEKIASAFIMEDDVDWDIRLLRQMAELATGVRTLSNVPLSAAQHSPYGDDWDIIWPGHCGEIFNKEDDRRFIINNDETVAPKAHQPWLVGLKDYPERTRIVHKTGAPICTFGYAVSLRGAQKILWWLAIKGYGPEAFDNSLSYLCRDGHMNIQCYSVQPMLMYHHRAAGPVDKDSDIQSYDKTKVRDKGITDNIILSARLNIEKMIIGSEDYILQW